MVKVRFIKTQAKPVGDSYCTVIDMQGIIELRAISRLPTGLDNLVKISKNEYCLKDTGEVREYSQSDSRADNKSSLAKSFRNLRHLLNENFIGAPNELVITLTYAENMTDRERLMHDIDLWKKRMKRRYPDFECIVIAEPQARGAWHCHIPCRFDNREEIFIPNHEIHKLWGHGFTKTKRIQGVDNIGAYLTAYLADIPLDESNGLAYNGKHEIVEKEVTDDDGKKTKKKFIKGGRLHMYPPGMKLYRKSKGIRKPDIQTMTYAQAKEIAGPREPDYSTARDIIDDNNKLLNTIFYEQYNLRKEKSQALNNEVPQNDAPDSNRRIPNRPASKGKQPKDIEMVPPEPELLPDIHEEHTPIRHHPAPVQAILHPPDRKAHSHNNGTILHPRPARFPRLVLQRGLHKRKHPFPAQASKGTAKGN